MTHPDDPVARLTRWADAGGTWQVLTRGGTEITVALLTCDGGEEMGRIVTADAELAAYVDAHAEADGH